MTSPLHRLKELFRSGSRRREVARRARRRDPEFGGSARADDIAKASPERAGELAGHPVERVDT
jgi:hypothetical protein